MSKKFDHSKKLDSSAAQMSKKSLQSEKTQFEMSVHKNRSNLFNLNYDNEEQTQTLEVRHLKLRFSINKFPAGLNIFLERK